MHGGEEIWECVCASIRSSDFFFFWLRDRCKLKKRKARVGHPGLSRGVVKLTGRPARNAAWRARRGSSCGTNSHAKTAQGHGVSNVACTLTGLEVAGRPSGGQKGRILRTIKSSMTSMTSGRGMCV